jgi:hypothetical protein
LLLVFAVRLQELPMTRPFWDRERRQLWFGDLLVKRFPRVARCQELILRAFQEDRWPWRIDSPLPGGCSDPHQSLRNAVRKLNQQEHPSIRFRVDGTGQGILWELIEHRSNTDRTHTEHRSNLDRRFGRPHNRRTVKK